MRPELLYLKDIVGAAEAIQRFLAAVDRSDFLRNELVASAVPQKLTVIGDAAARIPSEFREKHKNIEWNDIAAFRNIAVHTYFSVDWSTVWVTATRDVPELKQQILVLLSTEFPESSTPTKNSQDLTE